MFIVYSKNEIYFCMQSICKNIILPLIHSIANKMSSSNSDKISACVNNIVSELRGLRDDDDEMMDVFRCDKYSSIIAFAESVSSLAQVEMLDDMVSAFIREKNLYMLGDYVEGFIMYGVYVDKLRCLFI